jgi:predicted permease
MSFQRDRYARLRELLRGPRVDADVTEEFESHLALRVAALMAEGLSAEQARDLAVHRFGDRGQFHRETVAIDQSMLREQRRMVIIDAVWRELKQAARGLLRAPGFALIGSLTLALAIGASTAVYTMLDAVVLNPLPYPSAARLVTIDHVVPSMGPGVYWKVATASYFHYGEGARSFDGYGAYWAYEQNLQGRGEAFRGTTAQVTANLPGLLGARPAVGRFFLETEDVPDAPLVAVLSYELWQREYNSDPLVVGQFIEINGSAAEIVGVAPRGFALPDQRVDVWYPRRISLAGTRHANWHHLDMVARLRPGVSRETAQTELQMLARGLHERFPNVYEEGVGREDGFRPRVQDLRVSVVGDVSRILWILFGSVAVVMAVACANVANLFLVRVESKRNELAVRTALGAERAHLAVQSLSEALLLTMSAAGLGVWLAYGGLSILLALAPSSLPRLSDVHLAGGSIVFALLLGLLCGLLFGTFPLLRARADFGPLREAGRGLSTSRVQLRVRSVLVSAQIALALMLLAAGGLLLRSYQRMHNVQSGIDARNVLAVDVSIPFVRYNTYEKAALFWRDLSARVAVLPGVLRVGAGASLPFAMGSGCATLWVDPPAVEGSVPGCLGMTTQLPGYFETLGIPVRGRTPTWTDIQTGTGAIVITRAMAERLWPGQDAIGRGIRGNGPGEVYFRVVGVAEDFRGQGFTEPPSQLVFFPPVPAPGTQLWGLSTSLSLVVKTAGDPRQLVSAVRRVVHETERSAAIGSVSTMEQVVAASVTTTSFIMVLLGVAGGMALLLSIVGLYGVISYVVNRRRMEIGIRIALGAAARNVGAAVVLQSVRLAAIGIAVGLVGAFFTTRTLQSLLFETAPTDPLTLAGVSLLLLGTCVLASFIPARKATRVSPVEALKS